MNKRSIILLVVVLVFVLSAAMPALGAMNAPKPFHDMESPAFGKVHAKYKICANACHMGVSGHDLCGECHDLEAQCGACHPVSD